ncbi:MAG TPA: NADH-quinone oxidoreductase subunit NuoK [Legionellaceae bacterium]|nr:NADH-quinone oxidoreductase subunit NuoK [Legionellaceae bacterium]
MIPLSHYLILAAILFGIGLFGIVIHRRNVILLMVCIELLLLAVNTNLIAFSQRFGDVTGQVFVFFILTVAAAEAAIGLAIVMLLHRNRGNINVSMLDHLKG